MPVFETNKPNVNGLEIKGSAQGDLIFGSFADDKIDAQDGDDLIFSLSGDDEVSAGTGDDVVFAGAGHDTVNGGDGEDNMFGGRGNDVLVGNKGNDRMFGGSGDDMLVWNNGDGSDLMNGGRGHDQVQVNFNTDLVNDDLQNKDVAEFSVTDKGVQFARIELNDQSEVGLFQLDIRNTEELETNFGGGDDTAVLKDNVLQEIKLDLDGGDGEDTLDLSQVTHAVKVNLNRDKVGESKLENFEDIIGTEFDDKVIGDGEANEISGLGGSDTIRGRDGDDILVGNKGDDFVFGGGGDDMLVWNNGDGSDLLDGDGGYDTVQVNFDTDLVNDDLQNKDVAEFSVTDQGVQFARIEVNDQTEVGLFELDIRDTEKLETNFGGGDDTAVLKDNVLEEIKLDLDGGDGVDTLDLSQVDSAVAVNLDEGTLGTSKAVNFENVEGTEFNDVITGNDQDNVIAGGSGLNILTGGDGADTFVFREGDVGVSVITDFEIEVDQILIETSDPSVTTDSLLSNLSQDGDDVELALNGRIVTFEDTTVDEFNADSFIFG
ncbi:MAG: calcium-binding protein [Pseudomonadota bacterium]